MKKKKLHHFYHNAFNRASNFSASDSSSSSGRLPLRPALWLVCLGASVNVSSNEMSLVTEFSSWKRFVRDLDLESWARRSAENKQDRKHCMSIDFLNTSNKDFHLNKHCQTILSINFGLLGLYVYRNIEKVMNRVQSSFTLVKSFSISTKTLTKTLCIFNFLMEQQRKHI